ncbi:MAG: glycoside hydrolase family 3 N-terminal domain-containing protein [Hansschlegelia sp.]
MEPRLTPPRILTLALALVSTVFVGAATADPADVRIDALISRMTLEEKAGQLTMDSTQPPQEPGYAAIKQGVKDGAMGGVFNIHDVVQARSLQTMAVKESRLGIPLFLALDVVHGFRTLFPTPLAQAASWDMEAIRTAERIGAKEASDDGVNTTLAPMLDMSHDARWGRVVEAAGESLWLTSRIAEARLKGMQDDRLSAPTSVLACVKHFGANGAVEGGREYTALDLSERALRQNYLPPFKAASDAGARCMMAGLNAPDGVPTIANRRLITDILRNEWGFKGVVMSDFDGVKAMVDHGYAADRTEAARLAFEAGADIDMQSGAYIEALPKLVRDGAIREADVDAAVRRVLKVKQELGLFDDPYHGLDPAVTETPPPTAESLVSALDLAEKSIVLLKNQGDLLPLAPGFKRVAVIGPVGDSGEDTLGPWGGRALPSEAITLKRGLQERLGPDVAVDFTPGGSVHASRPDEIAAAVETARRADVVVLALGERFYESGEAQSLASLELPGDQMKLADAVLALGKPTVAVIMAGRPLVLTGLAARAPAIVNAWQLGVEGGRAIARVLMGDVAPVGRLPMTFPRSTGQEPLSYEQKPTGRPAVVPPKPYTMGYVDQDVAPLYPFGYGQTYTEFAFSAPRIDRLTLGQGGFAKVSVDVTNNGKRAGVAMAQLYLGIKVARASQPGKQLRGFARVELQPGETSTVEFIVSPQDFSYWTHDGRSVATAGPIEVMTGPDSADVKSATLDYRP